MMFGQGNNFVVLWSKLFAVTKCWFSFYSLQELEEDRHETKIIRNQYLPVS
jgi:hypothetical protein